jgi:hypothetical protein
VLAAYDGELGSSLDVSNEESEIFALMLKRVAETVWQQG